MSSSLHANEFEDRVVVVLGTRRSGTTWLSELLSSHPDVAGLELTDVEMPPGYAYTETTMVEAVPAESLVFSAIGDFWVNANRVDGDGVAGLMDTAEVAAALRRFVDHLFAISRDCTAPGARWFVEKSPDNVNRLAVASATHPDAAFVHLIRDGRDVARSLLAWPFAEGGPAAAAEEWVTGVRRVQLQQWRLRRFRELRYERLLADPVGEMRDLFEWIGLPVLDDVVRRLEVVARKQVARYGESSPVGAGKWRGLDPDQLAIVYDVAGDLLAELGYLD
ncbi:MAG: sulfotransferase [Acidimicrobiia bacterium]|nr:sulfotransferase [Acidimicrobiia bacterium]